MPLVLALIAAVPVLVILRLAVMPVATGRVARFARLHRLALTPDSQPRIVAYLSHTRRWRAVGVLAGYLVGLVWMLPQQRIGFQVSALLAGWLVGAVMAEIGYGSSRSAHRAATSVNPIVPGWLLRVPLALAAAALIGTALALVPGRTDSGAGQILAWGAGALACAAVVAGTNRYIANRTAVAADDDPATVAGTAAAAHSIGAITAVGGALALSCLAHQLDVIVSLTFGWVATALTGTRLLVTVGALSIAWFIASAAWPAGQAGSAPRTRPLARVLLVVATIVVASAGWAGYAWWTLRPPYPVAAINATATIRLTDGHRFDQDARALGTTGLTSLIGEPDDQQFIGRVDYTAPASAEADADNRYYVIVIDKRQNRVAPVLVGTDGGAWYGSFSELPRRYQWLSAMTPTVSENGYSTDGMAVSAAAASPGPVTFVGSFPRSVGLSPSDLMVVLLFTDSDGHTYWASRLMG
jgi:hypothetical protein